MALPTAPINVARLPVDAISFVLVVAAWCGALALAFLPAYVNELPGNSAKFYFFEVTDGVSQCKICDPRQVQAGGGW